MSYITDKFEAGEVHYRGFVLGWYFESTNEFRPLMNDAMAELHEAGLANASEVEATATAHKEHTEKTLTEYFESQEKFWNDPANADAQREQLSEMRAAFGPGETVVNVFTGKEHKL